MNLALVLCAGALGAVARHGLDLGLRRWFPDGPSPGILVANLLGSFVLGVVVGAAATRSLDESVRLAVGTGFCGAFTTFSTFSAQLAGMVERRERVALMRWTAFMVIGGGVASALGVAIGRM